MKLKLLFTLSLLFCNLLSNTSVAQTTLFTETFTGSLPAGWTKTDLSGNGAGNWQYTTTKPLNWSNSGFPGARPIMATSSSGYMMFDSNGQNAGTNDSKAEKADLVSPAINLSGYNSTTLKFEDYYWHVFNDTISVWVSTDGVNFTDVWTCYNDTCNSDYNTGRGDTIIVDISSIADNQSTVYVKFRWIGNYDLFWAIDDIKITGNLISGIKEEPKTNESFAYPNPAKDKLVLSADNFKQNSGSAKIEIINFEGKLIRNFITEDSGKDLSLDVSDLAAGVYLIKINSADQSSIKKFVKQ
jgi:hypothetical protein